MIRTALLSLAVLAGCSKPSAAPNLMSVPNVMQSITQARGDAGTYIFVTGGIYDGAATGQTATFIVTPNDSLICTFQTQPVLGGANTETTVTAHRLTIPGAYGRLAGAILPNTAPREVEYTTNFTIETGSAAGVESTTTGFGDPRFDAMISVFQAAPNPCWNFG